jgi:aspartyl protease family protein
MRQILIFAAVALAAGGYLARYADQAVTSQSSQAAAVQTSDQPTQVSAGQHRMELTSGRDGHFRVDARVDGRHIDFMVDTGASLVILRESGASMVGLHPMPRDYTADYRQRQDQGGADAIVTHRGRLTHRVRRARAGAARRVAVH